MSREMSKRMIGGKPVWATQNLFDAYDELERRRIAIELMLRKPVLLGNRLSRKRYASRIRVIEPEWCSRRPPAKRLLQSRRINSIQRGIA